MAWTNMANKSNGVVIDQNDWNQMVGNLLYLGGTTGDVKTGDYSIAGNFYAASGIVTVGGPAAGTGAVRLPNAAAIAWRNGAGSADHQLTVDSIARLTFGGTANWATTAGAATPASASAFLTCVVNGAALKIALYP